MKLTLGFSPCPNDTFIFDAMVNGKIDTPGITFDYVMEDVETLNLWAEEGKLDVTKLSFNAFLHTVNEYALLHSGSALGEGVGPLLVSAQPTDKFKIDQLNVAIPGVNTTANLLLSLAYPLMKRKTEMVFNEIETAVINGDCEAGVLIHEGRFTYEKKGLVKIADLGDWWEKATKAPIPLGGIVIRRNIDKKTAALVNRVIKKSIQWAWKHYPELSPFVTANAQEMDESVMRKHINLYVNKYTTDLGEDGRNAVKMLFKKAKDAGLLQEKMPESIFY